METIAYPSIKLHQGALLCLLLLHLPLPIRFGRIVSSNNNEILGAIIEASRQIAVDDVLGALCISGLGIDSSSAHVRDHGVSSAERVGGIAKRMILRSRLREPNIYNSISKYLRVDKEW